MPKLRSLTAPVRSTVTRDWERPDRDEWVAELRDTVQRATGPVVLVAHSLGCHTVAHWAHRHDAQVRAALLVAPPDIDYSASRGAPIAGFGPWPQGEELLRDLLAESAD